LCRLVFEIAESEIVDISIVAKTVEVVHCNPLRMTAILPFDQRACFIAGQAKSGTTLLAALLDSHPALLVLPQETAYFPTVLRKYRDAGRRGQFDYLTKESFSRVLFGGEP